MHVFGFLPIALLLGGLVGSCIVLLAFGLFIHDINLSEYFMGVIVGGILGLSWYVIPSGILFGPTDVGPEFSGADFLSEEHFLSLYLFWQAGMAALLGIFLWDRNASQQN